MIKGNAVTTALFVVMLAVGSVSGAEKKDEPTKEKSKLDGIKCLFCKMQVKEDVFVEYKGAKVFLGCEGCLGAFKADVKKVATKANAQLVATKQAKQKACPISGRPCKEEFKLTVGKAQVAFCCPNCQKDASQLKGDAQLEKLFSEEVFKKAFKVNKPKDKKQQT
jgi:hypothetical protein